MGLTINTACFLDGRMCRPVHTPSTLGINMIESFLSLLFKHTIHGLLVLQGWASSEMLIITLH